MTFDASPETLAVFALILQIVTSVQNRKIRQIVCVKSNLGELGSISGLIQPVK